MAPTKTLLGPTPAGNVPSGFCWASAGKAPFGSNSPAAVAPRPVLMTVRRDSGLPGRACCLRSDGDFLDMAFLLDGHLSDAFARAPGGIKEPRRTRRNGRPLPA